MTTITRMIYFQIKGKDIGRPFKRKIILVTETKGVLFNDGREVRKIGNKWVYEVK